MNGKRLDYLEKTVAQIYWEGFKTIENFQDQKLRIASESHWDVVADLDEICLRGSEEFLGQFRNKRSEKARIQATLGLVGMKTLDHVWMRDMAHEFERLAESTHLTEAGKLRLDSLRGILAVNFANLLTGSNHSKFLTEVSLGKDLKADPAGKGGKDSPPGKVWDRFCWLHINQISIPTKTELRKAVGFTQDHDKKHFSDYVKNLGLGGLAE